MLNDIGNVVPSEINEKSDALGPVPCLRDYVHNTSCMVVKKYGLLLLLHGWVLFPFILFLVTFRFLSLECRP